MYYRALINASNAGCNQAISNNATAVITPDLTISLAPQNLNQCINGTGQLTVVIAGGVGAITYQWQSSPNGTGSWANATGTGSTSSVYTPPSSSAGTTYYRVLVNATGNGCGQIESGVVVVEIDPSSTITINPPLYDVCINAFIDLTATVTGGSNSLVVQWQSGPSNTGPWTDISGATGMVYSIPTASTDTIYYRARVIDSASACNEPVSDE